MTTVESRLAELAAQPEIAAALTAYRRGYAVHIGCGGEVGRGGRCLRCGIDVGFADTDAAGVVGFTRSVHRLADIACTLLTAVFPRAPEVTARMAALAAADLEALTDEQLVERARRQALLPSLRARLIDLIAQHEVAGAMTVEQVREELGRETSERATEGEAQP